MQHWEGAEVSAWALGGTFSLRADLQGTGHQIGAVPLCCGKAWRDHSHRVVLGQFIAGTGIKTILPLGISAAVPPWEREKTVKEHELGCLRLCVLWCFCTPSAAV